GDDAMRDQSADGIIRAANFGNLLRFGIIVERAYIGDLAAGFRVDRGAVEDDFGFSAGWNFVHAAFFGDDRFDARVFRARAEVEIRFGAERIAKSCVNRLRGFLLRSAFPGCFGTRALLFHGSVETGPIDANSSITGCVLDEIAS